MSDIEIIHRRSIEFGAAGFTNAVVTHDQNDEITITRGNHKIAFTPSEARILAGFINTNLPKTRSS